MNNMKYLFLIGCLTANVLMFSVLKAWLTMGSSIRLYFALVCFLVSAVMFFLYKNWDELIRIHVMKQKEVNK